MGEFDMRIENSGLLGLLSLCAGACQQAQAADPGSISCTFYYRPAATEEYPEHEESVIEVRANEEESTSLGELELELSYADSSVEGAYARVAVTADDKEVMASLYQFEPGERPINQFLGDHGFTGLIYLTHPTGGGDYQLVCKAAP